MLLGALLAADFIISSYAPPLLVTACADAGWTRSRRTAPSRPCQSWNSHLTSSLFSASSSSSGGSCSPHPGATPAEMPPAVTANLHWCQSMQHSRRCVSSVCASLSTVMASKKRQEPANVIPARRPLYNTSMPLCSQCLAQSLFPSVMQRYGNRDGHHRLQHGSAVEGACAGGAAGAPGHPARPPTAKAVAVGWRRGPGRLPGTHMPANTCRQPGQLQNLSSCSWQGVCPGWIQRRRGP